MMRNLTNSIADLISGLQGVTVLFDMFGGGFNVEELMKNADAIDSLLQSLSLQRIVNRWGYPVNICTFVDLRGGVGRIIPLKKYEQTVITILDNKLESQDMCYLCLPTTRKRWAKQIFQFSQGKKDNHHCCHYNVWHCFICEINCSCVFFVLNALHILL